MAMTTQATSRDVDENMDDLGASGVSGPSDGSPRLAVAFCDVNASDAQCRGEKHRVKQPTLPLDRLVFAFFFFPESSAIIR